MGLDAEIQHFKGRTKKSAELFAKAKDLTPFGVHSNYRHMEPYPLYFSRAKASRIWDIDGNEYIDFNMAFGALIAGHSHPLLLEALRVRLEEGVLFGFEPVEAYDLAKVIANRFGLQMVRFSSVGSEATMHAIRLARAHTGRKKIIKFEGCYHGSQDHLLVSVKPSKAKAGHPRFPSRVASSQGIPEEVIANILVCPFNDIEAVDEVMRKHGDDVAAIILEPIPMNMGLVLPERDFLKGLRKLADEYNSILIFDEVKTCGKFYRGAAGHFGVKPDLMVMGKAIAGGYPLSVIGGSREVMGGIIPGVVAHAGTFNSNPLSVTASLVTLSKIMTEEAMGYASMLGDKLARAYTDIIRDEGLEAIVQWLGLSGALMFTNRAVRNWRDFLTCDAGKWHAYYIRMLNRGVIPAATGPDEQWTVSVQHTDDDVEKHIEAFKDSAKLIKDLKAEMPIVEAI